MIKPEINLSPHIRERKLFCMEPQELLTFWAASFTGMAFLFSAKENEEKAKIPAPATEIQAGTITEIANDSGEKQ
jgi:hypothetical protein